MNPLYKLQRNSKTFLYYLIGGILVLTYLLFTAKRQGDLFIYEAGSRDIFAGKDAYSIHYVDGFHYYYSTLFAILIYPLTFLPVYIGNLIWLALNAFFLYRIIVLISRYFNLTILTQKQNVLFFLIPFIFGLRFTLSNFHNQQITICILYLILEGLQLIFSGKKLGGALLIALGINIKLLPIVLLPYLLYRREFTASFLIVIFYTILLFIPGFVIGFAQNNLLISSWWNLINPANTIHNLDVDERSFHSLSTLLATLLVKNVPDKFALHIRRNIMDISYEHLVLALNIIRLVLVSFSLYFLRTKPFTAKVSTMHRFVEISYLLLLVPLIFPHQQDYAFLFIMPAVTCVIYALITERNTISVFKFRTILALTALSYLLCNLNLLFGQYREYYDHFKIMTYGALLIIPLLAISYPIKKRFGKS
ncbi:MAG TPA: glycosyltransferase family 87 protein [Bacteroidia bacterium]|nr:glycosyltransferase family 87 protein [Bacteroidia bacterium]